MADQSMHALQQQIDQLEAVLSGGAEQVPTEQGPVRYNLVEARKRLAELKREKTLLEGGSRLRNIRVYPVRP